MKKNRDLYCLAAVGLLLAGLVGGCAPLAIGAGAGVGYKVATDERTAGRQLDDATIATRVKLDLAGEREVPARRIDVDVVQGVVHLSGFVDNEQIKRRAGELAGAAAGVKGVRNNLKVGTRTWGEALDDRRIGARVKGALLKDEEVKAFGIDVDVYKKTVFLNGVVSSAGLKERIGNIAGRTEGVAGVINQIVVQ